MKTKRERQWQMMGVLAGTVGGMLALSAAVFAGMSFLDPLIGLWSIPVVMGTAIAALAVILWIAA